jgi:hypothetical protein
MEESFCPPSAVQRGSSLSTELVQEAKFFLRIEKTPGRLDTINTMSGEAVIFFEQGRHCMKGMMRFLAAANLVTLSEEEQSEIQPPPVETPVTPAEPPAETPPVLAQYAESEVVEGRSFDEIFLGASLPISPFPAERLLRLLDGLRAMDEATRKAAVRAMDNADDSWTIADPVIDAQRKIAVLEAYKEVVNQQVAGIEEKAAAEAAELKANQERAVAEIRKQIAELERLLEREMRKTTEQIAGLEANAKASREAAAREARRVSAEIDRMQEIPAQFAQPTTQQ